MTFTEQGNALVADKTVSQIIAAYASGLFPIARYLATSYGYDLLPCVCISDPEDDYTYIDFRVSYSGYQKYITIDNGVISTNYIDKEA